MQRPFIVLLILTGSLLYLRALSFPVAPVDDAKNIFANPLLNPPSLDHTAKFWKAPNFGLYIPVTYSLWSLIAAAGIRQSLEESAPLFAAPFHLANVALHVLNSILVYLILLQFFECQKPLEKKDRVSAFLGALLFLAHPLQVEPVAWISGARDLLSAFFSLSAFLVFMHKRGKHSFYSLALFVLALLSKPSAVLLVGWIGITQLFVFNRSWKESCGRAIPWAILAGAAIWVTRAAQWVGPSLTSYSLPARGIIAMDALSFYAKKVFWPARYSIDYGHSPESVLSHPHVLSFLFLITGVALLFHYRREYRLGLLLFFSGFLPVLGLVSFRFQWASTVADRYAYLALVGVALLVAGACRKARWLSPVTVGVLLAAAVTTNSFLSLWENNETLLTQSLVVSPNSRLCHMNLATFQANHGRTREAIFHYEAALKEDPDSAAINLSLGSALLKAGRKDEALFRLKKAVRLDPNNYYAQENLRIAQNF